MYYDLCWGCSDIISLVFYLHLMHNKDGKVLFSEKLIKTKRVNA